MTSKKREVAVFSKNLEPETRNLELRTWNLELFKQH